MLGDTNIVVPVDVSPEGVSLLELSLRAIFPILGGDMVAIQPVSDFLPLILSKMGRDGRQQNQPAENVVIPSDVEVTPVLTAGL